MQIAPITPRTCIVRNTAAHRGRSLSVEPTTTASRFLHYGRIILEAGAAPVRFETGDRETGLIVLGGRASVAVDGQSFSLGKYDAVYAPREDFLASASANGATRAPRGLDVNSRRASMAAVIGVNPKQVVKAWVEAFNRADVEALAGFYAEAAVNHQVAETPIEGRSAIREMFVREFARAKMVCLIENLFEDGEWAILEWRDPLGLRGCGFFHVRDSRIQFQRGYWDKLSFLRMHNLPLPSK